MANTKTKMQKIKAKQQNKYNSLKGEYDNLLLRHTITAGLLDAKDANPKINEFKRCLIEFIDKWAGLKDSAWIANKLFSIHEKLEISCSYPKLFDNAIVGVGGGFSSGKSTFVNSFIENENIKLAISMEPTTALATYVFDGDYKNLVFNKKGSSFDVSKIDGFDGFSHSFIKDFEFNLREIISFVILSVPMSIKNICFIDTPGYNPATKDSDINVARSNLANVGSLLWIIDAQNGTIPRTDLEFLDSLDLDKKDLFIVLNKSELKTPSDIESILDKIEENLSDYDIEYVGISAYSAEKKTEFAYRKMKLAEFFENRKPKRKIQNSIMDEIYSIDKKIQTDLLKEIKEKGLLLEAFK